MSAPFTARLVALGESGSIELDLSEFGDAAALVFVAEVDEARKAGPLFRREVTLHPQPPVELVEELERLRSGRRVLLEERDEVLRALAALVRAYDVQSSRDELVQGVSYDSRADDVGQYWRAAVNLLAKFPAPPSTSPKAEGR